MFCVKKKKILLLKAGSGIRTHDPWVMNSLFLPTELFQRVPKKYFIRGIGPYYKIFNYITLLINFIKISKISNMFELL